MRLLRYNVAASLDGYIAREDGSYDWIIMDPAIDFAALFAQFDTLVMGRKTYEVSRDQGMVGPSTDELRVVVASRTMKQEENPGITVLSDDLPAAVAAMKQQPGKDLWLFGGGSLFRQMLDAGLVDRVEVAVMPVLLSKGIPLLPPGSETPAMTLLSSTAMPSGILMLSYGLGKTGA